MMARCLRVRTVLAPVMIIVRFVNMVVNMVSLLSHCKPIPIEVYSGLALSRLLILRVIVPGAGSTRTDGDAYPYSSTPRISKTARGWLGWSVPGDHWDR